jgi:hypothetical protein
MCLAFAMLSSSPAGAVVTSYVEDFTTLDYCDTVQTTAWWDTLAGEAKLHPFALSIEGSLATSGQIENLTIYGDYAYLAAGGSGLHIVDISDPTNPTLANTHNTPVHAIDVAISGNYAHVADYTSGLQVVDITDPTNPSLAGSYGTPGTAYSVAIAGDYAYIADADSGLTVVDISDPANPALEGRYVTADFAYGIALAGDYAYVAVGYSGLQVIDISDPANPASAGIHDTPSLARSVCVSGDYAYVADNSAGLQVIDISDPENPASAGAYDPSYGFATDVAVSGDCAYYADLNGLRAVDITDPTSPAFESGIDLPGSARGVVISGEYAYVADYTDGLKVIRVSYPIKPVIATDFSYSQDAFAVAVSGDYAYAGFGSAGLTVVNISDPASPAFAGNYVTPGAAYGIAIEGDYAYVADYSAGLTVVDISDPTNPALAGGYDTPGLARGIAISGNHAYVGDGTQGIQIIDISDPTDPVFVTNYVSLNDGDEIAISGDYAYLAVGDHFEVVDISNPAAPTNAGSCTTPGTAYGVKVSGDYAYLADYSGLAVVDISNPASPAVVGVCNTPGWVWALDVSGDRAFVTASLQGVYVIDISVPTSPALADSVDTPSWARGIAISGDYAYVADGEGDLQIIEVSQRHFDAGANVARSTVVSGTDGTILQARLSGTYSDSILWEMSSDGGGAWQEFLPGAGYEVFASPGSNLHWRSTHVYTSGGVNPLCSDLAIDWLYDFPIVASVTDIPDDQGRQVSLSWTRSGYDVVGSAVPVTEYAVYRRIDYDYGQTCGGSEPALLETASERQSTDIKPDVLYPPGEWHFLTAVPARAEDDYAVVVPTLGDSTVAEGMQYSTFFVSALTATPGVYFDSPVDSGYSVDNLAPSAPLNLTMPSPTDLAWEECPEEDFDYFTVYGSAAPGLDPTALLIGYTVGTAMDVTDDAHDYYHVTATDFAGNEGSASSVENTSSGVGRESDLPAAFALRENRPNPFEASTVIAFELPEPCDVRLEVFDAEGRVVRLLTETAWPAGRHSVAWTGENDAGEMAGPGVYFVRMRAGEFTDTGKMLLMR